MKNSNEIMQQLAEYIRIQDETAAIIEGLKDELKSLMIETGNNVIVGVEHKASWKEIRSSRFNSKAFKADNPDMYQKYMKEIVSKRFTFS